ncbi:hypothetical protein [Eubacterium coprostanoligenes]|nr:hypothetical protein [Eubacterium coprostanoligenes]
MVYRYFLVTLEIPSKIVYNTYIPLVIIHDVTILVINLDNKMITGAF